MSTTNVVNSTRIETLSKDNYDTWRIQVEALLVKNDTWQYVSGEKPQPVITGESSSRITYDRWIAEDRKAKSDLILCISPSELKHARNCTTSREIWERLETVYASKGPARKAALLKQLIQSRMKEGDDVRTHVMTFYDIVDKLQAMGIEINGDLLTIMLLYSLPSSFENFRCAIESRDHLPDAESLRVKIIEEYDSRKQKAAEKDSNALIAKQFSRPADTPNKTKNNPHVRTRYKCNKCNKFGHKASVCYSKKNTKDQNVALSEESSFNAFQADTLRNVEQWCLDSGSTSHLCNSIQSFTDTKEIGSKIKLASNVTATAVAKGNVKISTSNGRTDKVIRLENTLYVPNLRTNLLSVSKIVDKDHTVTFKKDTAIVNDPQGRISFIADRKGDLFLLREGCEQACVATGAKKEDVETWHEKLGHLNYNDLNVMTKDHKVSGMHFKTSYVPKPCEVCLGGKMSRLPFPTNQNRATNILDIVHTDVCGPMRTRSNGNALYLLTFTDDHTRWCEVFFLKSKSEVASKFLEYKCKVENHTGRRIKAIQSDNGKEFCNSEMDAILKNVGIHRRLTTVYTPQQNGVAERRNRTLIETARCLMIQSGLPPVFWAEAVNTANYIKNRCVTRSLNGDTPYEKWHKKKPYIGYFAIFGEKVYILNKSPDKGKLDPRGIPGIFVGYSDTSKGFKIWVPSLRKIVVTRDVKFLHRIEDTNRQEDIIFEETKNGRFQMLVTDDIQTKETNVSQDHRSSTDEVYDNHDTSDVVHREVDSSNELQPRTPVDSNDADQEVQADVQRQSRGREISPQSSVSRQIKAH